MFDSMANAEAASGGGAPDTGADAGRARAASTELSLADQVAAMPAGLELGRLLVELGERFPPGSRPPCGLPPSAADRADGWSDELAVQILVGWERFARWVAAQQQGALIAVAGPTRQGDDDWPVDEIGAALRLATGTAIDRVVTARELTGRMSMTQAALAAGDIPIWYASHLAEQLADRTDDVAADVETTVLAKAGTQTFGQFKRSVAKALAAADPQTFEVRHAAAAEARRVIHYTNPDAMGAVLIEAPITTTADFYDALSAYASRRLPGDTRTLDQRRADAVDELTAFLRAGAPAEQGRRRQLGVLIDWDTLRQLADQPGELAGYGPVPASLARRWAYDADWRRWTTDPVTGHLLDYGTGVYKPPADVREFVIARDQTCRFPTGSTPAHRTDQDHAIPHGQAGGRTSSANVTSLGGRPHRAKHEAGWRLRRHPLGEADWISPAGLHYRTYPADYHWMRRGRPTDSPDPPESADPADPPEPPESTEPRHPPDPNFATNQPDPRDRTDAPDKLDGAIDDQPTPGDTGDPDPPPL